MFSGLRNTKGWIQVLDRHTAMINVVVLGLILVIGLMYIVQVNGSVSKGYDIRDLESRIDEIRLQNQVLELKVAENRSMAAIDERVNMLGMVQANTPEFVTAGAPTVALNR